jgi:acetyltransferase-like isoleucine patch superfamily enzyme
LTPEVYIHPRALVESDAVGDGTRVWAFAHIMAGATVGRRCNVGQGAFIESGVTIGDDVIIKNGVAVYRGVHVGDSVFLGPNCVFTNDRRPRAGRFKRSSQLFEDTWLEDGASVGANATIVCGVRIGQFAMVAAGAVVTRDVSPFTVVAGVPATRRGHVCACGELLDPGLRCRCGREYRIVGQTLEPIQKLFT